MSCNTKLFIAAFATLSLTPGALWAEDKKVATPQDTPAETDYLTLAEAQKAFVRFSVTKTGDGNTRDPRIVVSGYVRPGCTELKFEWKEDKKGEEALGLIDEGRKCRDSLEDPSQACNLVICEKLEVPEATHSLKGKPNLAIKFLQGDEKIKGETRTVDFDPPLEFKSAASIHAERVADLNKARSCDDPDKALIALNELEAIGGIAAEEAQKERNRLADVKTFKTLKDILERIKSKGKGDSSAIDELRYFADTHVKPNASQKKVAAIIDAYKLLVQKASDEDLPGILADVKNMATRMDNADPAMKVIQSIAIRVEDPENSDSTKLRAARKILEQTQKEIKRGEYTVSKESKKELADALITIRGNTALADLRAGHFQEGYNSFYGLMSDLSRNTYRACVNSYSRPGDFNSECDAAQATLQNVSVIPDMAAAEWQQKQAAQAELNAKMAQMQSKFGPTRQFQPSPIYSNPFSNGLAFGSGQYGNSAAYVPGGIQAFR